MADRFTVREYGDALVHEFAAAIEAVLGGSVAAAGTSVASGDGFTVTFTVTGGLAGSIKAWVSQPGGATVAQRVMGMNEEPDAAVIADMLGEMWTQAASALSLKEPFTAVKLTASAPVAGVAGAAPTAVYSLTLDGAATAQIALTAAVEAPAPSVTNRHQAPLTSLPQSASLDVVLDIDLPIVVRFGRTQMTLKTLAALGPGSIVDMGRSPDAPVEMLVGDLVIARGEVVIVAGNYGLRITDLASPADRVRALEA
jgi:flagellar motor switch protein FliN/FliY